MINKKRKIISIVGSHSCGSTLLSRLLGESEGIVDVGEILNLLASIYRRNLGKKVLCSCNGDTDSCDLLTKVSEQNNLQNFTFKQKQNTSFEGDFMPKSKGDFQIIATLTGTINGHNFIRQSDYELVVRNCELKDVN